MGRLFPKFELFQVSVEIDGVLEKCYGPVIPLLRDDVFSALAENTQCNKLILETSFDFNSWEENYPQFIKLLKYLRDYFPNTDNS